MHYQRISEIVKTSIIEAFQRDEDYYEVARLFNVKRTTAHGVVKRWQEHGVVVRPRGGAREATTKVDDEMKEAAVAIVERNAAYTLKQINAQLRQTFPQKPHISISTLATMLDGQLVAMKNLEDAPVERNSPDTKEERRQYATWLAAEGVNQNIVYVDEYGFNLYTRRTRGRALVGQRAVRQVAASRGRNLNLLMAISKNFLELKNGLDPENDRISLSLEHPDLIAKSIDVPVQRSKSLTGQSVFTHLDKAIQSQHTCTLLLDGKMRLTVTVARGVQGSGRLSLPHAKNFNEFLNEYFNEYCAN